MNEEKETGKAFDFGLFKRVFTHTKPYKSTFFITALSAILQAGFAIATPIVVRFIINDAITNSNQELLLTLLSVMAGVLLGQVFFQLLFTYNASLLGESVIKDVRIRLFKKIIGFKMTYFDNSSIGLLVTRAVADMQRIGEIFSQGFFVIVADLLKMFAAVIAMLIIDWRLALIVFAILPLIIYATRLFQKAMKMAFIEVRRHVSNLA